MYESRVCLSFSEFSTSSEERERGNKAFKASNYADAINGYVSAVVLDPNDHRSWANLSECFARLGDWQASAQTAWQSVHAQPDFLKGHWRLGRALNRSGSPYLAQCAVEEACRRFPYSTELQSLKTQLSDACSSTRHPEKPRTQEHVRRNHEARDQIRVQNMYHILTFISDFDMLRFTGVSRQIRRDVSAFCNNQIMLVPVSLSSNVGLSGLWQMFPPWCVTIYLRCLNRISFLANDSLLDAVQVRRFHASACIMMIFTRNFPKLMLYFGKVDFDENEIQCSGYGCSSHIRLSGDGRTVHFRLELVEEEQSICVQPDHDDYWLGTRRLCALSHEFEAFYSEVAFDGAIGGLDGHSEPLVPTDSRLYSRLQSGEALPVLLAIETEPVTRLICSCGNVAKCAKIDSIGGCCWRCGQITPKHYPQHTGVDVSRYRMFQNLGVYTDCAACGLHEYCHECLSRTCV